MAKYSLVVPVYRGQDTIGPLLEKASQFFERGKLDYEVVFVYDCGPDKSWEKIQELKKAHPAKVKGIRLTRNFGQHNALICGFKHATGDFIVTMDEDLQHDPEDIALLIARQKEKDFDVVYGRYDEPKHNFFRNFTSAVIRKLLSFAIADLHPHYSAFRLIKADIARQTVPMNNSFTFLDGYLSWITHHVTSAQVQHSSGLAKQSSYTLSKLINHAINIFLTFSLLPIRLLTLGSFTLFTLTIVYSVYLFVRRFLFNDLVPGYASTMIAVGMGVGTILLALGIIGEYLYRISLKTTRRPSFLEGEIL